MSDESLPPFEECFRKLYPLLVSVAYRLTSDQSASEELATDALMVGYRRWPDFQPQGMRAFRAYLRVVTTRRALKHLRKRLLRRVREGEFWIAFYLLGDAETLSRVVTRVALSEIGTIARRVLSEEEFHLISLKLEGMTVREIADVLDTRRSTVQDHAAEALGKLRRALGAKDLLGEARSEVPGTVED